MDPLQNVLVPIAKAVATRVIFGAIGVVISMVVAFYYLVDRTLAPLTDRIGVLEATINTRVGAIEQRSFETAQSFSGLESKSEANLNALSRIENSINSFLQPQLAYFAVEQKEITERIARIEALLPNKTNFHFDRSANPFEVAFSHIDLDNWFIALRRDERNMPYISVIRRSSPKFSDVRDMAAEVIGAMCSTLILDSSSGALRLSPDSLVVDVLKGSEFSIASESEIANRYRNFDAMEDQNHAQQFYYCVRDLIALYTLDKRTLLDGFYFKDNGDIRYTQTIVFNGEIESMDFSIFDIGYLRRAPRLGRAKTIHVRNNDSFQAGDTTFMVALEIGTEGKDVLLSLGWVNFSTEEVGMFENLESKDVFEVPGGCRSTIYFATGDPARIGLFGCN